MGYYWDQIGQKWIPRPRWDRRASEKRRTNRRRQLPRQLLDEIDDIPVRPPDHFEGEDAEAFAFMKRNSQAAKLYASLLARALVGTDEMLMKEWGNQIAELTAGGEEVAK
jgi:hypothetical protein